MSFIDRIIFDDSGYTGATYYFRLVQRKSGKIWDGNSESVALDTSWANSAVSMTETGQTGQYPIVIPDDVPAGLYHVIVYTQAGGSPAKEDNIKEKYVLQVGSIFGF